MPERTKIKACDPASGVQIGWDSTSIKATMKCMRYYAYSILWGLQPNQTSVHLEFGGLYAKALENFYKYRARGDDLQTAARRVVREALESTWDRETGLPIDWGDPKKNRYTLVRSVVWYLDQFGDEKDSAIKTHHMSDGTPAVELSFRFNMTDDIILSGHLDRVVEFQGALWPMDQKTTGGTIGPYFFDQFKPDTQFTLYALAGKLILQAPMKGVIIDGAQIAVGFTRFERGFTMRTEAQITDWWHGTEQYIALTQHITAGAKSPEDFPMNTESCGNYGGCAFREICASSPRIRPNLIATKYKQRVWDPLEPR